MESKNIIQLRRELLRAPCNLLGHASLTLPPIPPCISDVTFLEEEVITLPLIQNGCELPLNVGEVFLSSVTEASLITSGNDVKKVLSLSLLLQDSQNLYIPGNCIGILPHNSDDDVEKFADVLNVKDLLYKKCLINIQDGGIKKKSFPNHIPRDSSLFHILKTCVDLRTIPKKVLLRVLSEYTSDEYDRRCLQELCSKEGSSLYNIRILEQGTTIVDVLSVFSTCHPPIGRILELLPRLLPRPYSIASSPLANPNEVRIIFTVVEQPQEGICSGWLYKLVKPLLEESNGTTNLTDKITKLSIERGKTPLQLPVYFRKSNGFNLPDDPLVSLILIGPGTGIAPFLGFLQHRASQKKLTPDIEFGEILLFYGCRYEDRDFLCRKELEKFQKEGIVSHTFVSFSRDREDKCKYVQDNISKNAQMFVRKFLDDNSIMYVCGDGKRMAKDVWDRVVKVISSEKGISEEEAFSILTVKQKEGSYRQDIWL